MTFEVSDEQYETLRAAATAKGQTPDAVLAQLMTNVIDLIETLRPHERAHAFETEDWFRHLGATEEEIRASAALAAGSDYDGDDQGSDTDNGKMRLSAHADA